MKILKILGIIALGLFGLIVISSILQAMFYPESLKKESIPETVAVVPEKQDTATMAKFDPYAGLTDKQKLETTISLLESHRYMEITDLSMALVNVKELNSISKDILSIPDVDSLAKLKAEAKRLLSGVQKKYLPKDRKVYGELSARKMWRDNGYVDVYGKNNTTIALTSSIFANNANIEDTYKALMPTLKALRFKEVHFKWYKGQTQDVNYYEIGSEPDDVVIWNYEL